MGAGHRLSGAGRHKTAEREARQGPGPTRQLGQTQVVIQHGQQVVGFGQAAIVFAG